MKIKLSWEEYQKFALEKIVEKYPTLVNGEESVEFKKEYSYDGEGDMYDFPSFIYIEVRD